MTNDTFDAIVVGGGHNGLVAAAYLARAKWKVLVLERRHVLGGACNTEEVFPGYKVSRCAYVVSLFRPEIVRDFKLQQFGYETLVRDPSSFSPYPGGRHLLFWSDEKRTCEEISRFSAKDAARFGEFNRHLERLVKAVDPLLTQPPPDPDKRNWLGWLGVRRLGPWDSCELKSAMGDLLRIASASAADYLSRWFESEELKVRLCTDGVIGLMAGPRTPGTAYGMFHHLMGQVDGRVGEWAYVRGGMGQIPKALAAYVESQKGVILTEAPVKRVLLKGVEVRGVVLEDGREFKSSVVLSNADPKRTFLGMFDELDLPEDLVREIRMMKFASASTKINVAARGLPDFAAFPGTQPGPQHRGTIHFSPDIDYIERAYEEAKWGRPSTEPFVEMGIPSVVDPSVAPPGKHLFSFFTQYAPYTRADGRPWDASAEKEYAESVFRVLRQYITNWDDIVEDFEVLTPPKLEAEFGLSGGNIFHGEMGLDQILGLRPTAASAHYRTPIEGFYLCGAGTHPGGGVFGAPGRNAAHVVLRERSR